MNIWFAKSALIAASVVMVLIRAPHGKRSRTVRVVRSRRGPLETFLLTCAWVSFFLPLIWAFIPGPVFADYPLRPLPFGAGVLLFAYGLWIFYRSHADLGINWSISLEVREEHRLVTGGIYRHVRHPMYLSLFLYSLGQALVVPNWMVGPSYLVAFSLLFALRVGREERMMLEVFGKDYHSYMARTRRLLPGLW